MLQIASATPADVLDAPTTLRLDALAAQVIIRRIVIRELTTPDALTVVYERMPGFAPGLWLTLLECAYRSLDGCSGWTYIDRRNGSKTRKAILIGAEAIAHGEPLNNVVRTLGLQGRYVLTVLRLIEVTSIAAYRLPTAESPESISPDLDVARYLEDPERFSELREACKLNIAAIAGPIVSGDCIEHNALVNLRRSAATAVALQCRVAGIRPDTICSDLRLTPELQSVVDDHYLAIQAPEPVAKRLKTAGASGST